MGGTRIAGIAFFAFLFSFHFRSHGFPRTGNLGKYLILGQEALPLGPDPAGEEAAEGNVADKF